MQALADGQGVLKRSVAGVLRPCVDRALRKGDLVAVLPGVYAERGDATRLEIRARAVMVADPEAVVTGTAAAILGGWTDLGVPAVITVASRRLRSKNPGFRFERRTVPPGLTKLADGIRVTTFPLTALDLAVEQGDDRIDDALRRGVEPAKLRQALELSGRRAGFGPLRPVMASIRDRPWSKLERLAHELLRAAGIGGWRANRAIYASYDDRLGYGDLVFYGLLLVIELDSRRHHGDEVVRARDAARDLRFAQAGWEVVRVPSWLVLKEPETFVRVVTKIVDTRRRRR